jgi:hypothetical protein
MAAASSSRVRRRRSRSRHLRAMNPVCRWSQPPITTSAGSDRALRAKSAKTCCVMSSASARSPLTRRIAAENTDETCRPTNAANARSDPSPTKARSNSRSSVVAGNSVMLAMVHPSEPAAHQNPTLNFHQRPRTAPGTSTTRPAATANTRSPASGAMATLPVKAPKLGSTRTVPRCTQKHGAVSPRTRRSPSRMAGCRCPQMWPRERADSIVLPEGASAPEGSVRGTCPGSWTKASPPSTCGSLTMSNRRAGGSR